MTGAPIAQNAALAELRADFAISPMATLGLRYTGQFGRRQPGPYRDGGIAVEVLNIVLRWITSWIA